MAQTLTLGPTAVPVGTRVFLIDGLPGNSSGFELLVGRNASWLALGPLFTVTIEISVAGAPFQHWSTVVVPGGPEFDKSGNPRAVWPRAMLWPGENDGSGQNRRRVLRGTDLRVTLTVDRAGFSVDSLNLRTI
jgi:hypothetical protein